MGSAVIKNKYEYWVRLFIAMKHLQKEANSIDKLVNLLA